MTCPRQSFTRARWQPVEITCPPHLCLYHRRATPGSMILLFNHNLTMLKDRLIFPITCKERLRNPSDSPEIITGQHSLILQLRSGIWEMKTTGPMSASNHYSMQIQILLRALQNIPVTDRPISFIHLSLIHTLSILATMSQQRSANNSRITGNLPWNFTT